MKYDLAKMLSGNPHPLEWRVERMGEYVVLHIEGQLNHAIMPFKKGQAKSVIKAMQGALDQMEKGSKANDRPKRRSLEGRPGGAGGTPDRKRTKS